MVQRHRSVKPQYKGVLQEDATTWSGDMDMHYEPGSKIHATEKLFLKAIMGKIKKVRAKKEYIREELSMEDIQNQIKENRLRWF
jgi:hypothetical protein